MKPSLYLIALSLFLYTCGKQDIKNIVSEKVTANLADEASLMLTSPDGDTIPINVPLPVKGKHIHPDSIIKPVKKSLKGNPQVVPAYSNVHPIGNPEIKPLPKEPAFITPGENGIPLPETILAQGKTVPIQYPQPVKALPPRKADEAIYDLQYLDVDQGLHSSFILTLTEDSKGNLWIGTLSGGAIRFDGHTFTHFTSKEGLAHNNVYSIVEDQQGNLWFATMGGVSQYDGKSFINYTVNEGLASNYVRSMFKDSDDNLWFGSFGGGVSRFEPNANNGEGSLSHFTDKEGLSDNRVLSILEDSRGNIWFGTWGGVSRFTQGRFTNFSTKEGLVSDQVTSLLEDQKGNIWIGTYNGVSIFDGDRFTNYNSDQGIPSGDIWPLLEDHEGRIWCGTWNNGVIRLSPKDNWSSYIQFSDREGVPGNLISSVLENSQGNIWFGTQSGLGLYKEKSFSHLSTNEGLSDNDVLSILEDRNGFVWFGTRGGLNRYDGEKIAQFTTKEGLSDNWSTFIEEDRLGNLWFGTQGSVNLYIPDTYRIDSPLLRRQQMAPPSVNKQSSFTLFSPAEGLPHHWAWSMVEDRRGNLWFATWGGVGLFKPEHPNNLRQGDFFHFTTDEGLLHNNVLSVIEDHQKNLWFASWGGVSRYALDSNSFQGNLTHYPARSEVISIIEDQQGKIWFGTQGEGVGRFDPNDFPNSLTYFTTTEGLSNNFVSSIIEDDKRNIWLGTQKGITLMIPTSVDSSEGTDYKVFTFDKMDGLKYLLFNINSVHLDHENRIWWGATAGVSMLDLNQFKLPTAPPKNVRLSNIEIGQQFIDFRKLLDTAYQEKRTTEKSLSNTFDSVAAFYNYPTTMTLPYDINHLTFHFSAIDWAAPHKIKFSYLLEGLSEDWSLPQSGTTADYRNLPHGTFTLKVKSIGAAQIWSEPFEYTFTIRPPWWLTGWAYGAYSLVAFSFLFMLYRFLLNRQLQIAETYRLRELDQVKSRLYTNITHEFRTLLTIISGMTDQIREQPKKRLDDGLSMIKRNSLKLLNLTNQMLDLRKVESNSLPVHLQQDDILSFTKYLMESFYSYSAGKNIRLHFISDLDSFVMDFDPDKIFKIVSNLLSNAIKFTKEDGDVYLSVRSLNQKQSIPSLSPQSITSEVLEIQIKDTGIGISESQLPYIFDRFYQADHQISQQTGGAGIGLALTRELVTLLRGEITVKSRLGAGTIFSVFLPVTRKAPSVENISFNKEQINGFLVDQVIPGLDNVAAHLNEEVPLILIVEDNRDVVYILRIYLEKDYRLEVASNGREGIDIALDIIPDLIISDVMMPEVDGLVLCQTLKEDQRSSHIPIILLTAKADQDDKIEGLQMGADAYLAKPFDKEELRVRIQQLIELRRHLQAKYLSGNFSVETATHQEDIFVSKVRQLILDHLDDDDFSISQLSRELHINRVHLHRKIKALTGKTAAHFIRHIRLQEARRILLNTDLNISEIAYEVGFKDPAYFTRVFTETFGESPSAMRNHFS